MSARTTAQRIALPDSAEVSATAGAYNQAGDGYRRYADGDLAGLYAFDSRYAYGDRYIWTLLDRKLCELRIEGREEIRILDAGCGPGTWLRRVVQRAHDLGFARIRARGFDLSETQVELARTLGRDVARLPGVSLGFEVGDLTRPFEEADASVDLSLCLYGVLNHVRPSKVAWAMGEFARVTRGVFVSTVRAAGSTPSIFIGSIDQARSVKLDNAADRCEIELKDGRRLTMPCHLFTATEVWRLAAERFEIEDLMGLDLFHGRFATDPRWNPDFLTADGLRAELERLEAAYARQPGFIDRAAHLLLVGQPRRPAG